MNMSTICELLFESLFCLNPTTDTMASTIIIMIEASVFGFTSPSFSIKVTDILFLLYTTQALYHP